MSESTLNDNSKKNQFLSGADWEILYEHGGEEIKEIQQLFTEIFKDRANQGNDSPVGDTIGALLGTVPENSRNKIYKLFGKAILNCKKKGFLTNIKLK